MKSAIYNILLSLVMISFSACAVSQSNFKVGKQYYDEGNFEQAIIELEKASKSDTSTHDRISAFEYLGDAYSRKGDLDSAVLSYKNAYELIRTRIGEIIDRQKTLKRGQKYDLETGNYNTQGKMEKLSEERSKLNIRSEEVRIKLVNLK